MTTQNAPHLAAVTMAGIIALSFGAARAQVLEIGDGGAVVVHDWPGSYAFRRSHADHDETCGASPSTSLRASPFPRP